MSDDPKRWLDDEQAAPPGARELLAHARRTPPADKRALALSAAALLELGTQPSSAAAAVLAKLSGAPAALAGLPVAGKVALAITTVAVVTVAGAQLATRSAHEPAARRAQTAVVSSRPPSAHGAAPVLRGGAAPEPIANALPPAPVEPSALPAPSEPALAQPVARTAAPQRRARTRANMPQPPARSEAASASEPAVGPEAVDELALEVRWLDQARALLKRDPAAALAHADAHAQRFASGALSAERELIAVDALQRLGRATDARARADALLARNPGSLYRGRLQRVLGQAR